MQSGLYITTSRCDGPATTRCNDGGFQTSYLSIDTEGCAVGVQIATSNNETNSISDGQEYLSVLNEQPGINHIKTAARVADKELVDQPCGANGQQLDNLQANEEIDNEQQIIEEDQPYLSINDAIIADVEHNTEATTRAMEEDITGEYITEEDRDF